MIQIIKANQTKSLLLIILIFFLCTRLYKITDIPPSLYWDEASIGYNAYSILKTGRDEWGQFLPIEFKAFGEYKLPVYIYSLLPFQAIFGLEDWIVRLPAVIFSLGSVILLFLLSKRIFESWEVGIISSFLMTISSWFFIFSRTGFEATAGVFFFLCGIYFFLIADKKIRLMIMSILSFMLSMYSYNSFRIVSPITVIILSLFSWQILKSKKDIYLTVPIILFFIITAITFMTASQKGAERLSEIGIFSSNNKKEITGNFIRNYISHFNPNFLVINGDSNLRSQQPGFGELNILETVLILLGLYFILSSKKQFLLPVIFLLIGPLPAAITKESPHALRSIAAVPFISMVAAFGLYQIYTLSKKRIVLVVIIALLTAYFTNYYINFLTNYSTKSSQQWQYGYKKIFIDYGNQFKEFDHIIISDYYNQPYIFTLSYLKYDPEKFAKYVQRNTSIRKETSVVKSFDKFIFSSISFYDFPKGKNLIFAHPSERMDEINYKETIRNLDGSLSLYVYEYER